MGASYVRLAFMSAILLLALVVFAIGVPETAQAVFSQAQAWITTNAS